MRNILKHNKRVGGTMRTPFPAKEKTTVGEGLAPPEKKRGPLDIPALKPSLPKGGGTALAVGGLLITQKNIIIFT